MNEMQMIKILEQYSQNYEPVEGQVKVMRVPDYKTVYIEQIGKIGRSIMFKEYKLGGKTYWAGYSTQSDTVFVSQATRE